MCFSWISEQTAIISLYSTNLSVFIAEAESVYSAVRTGSLNQTVTLSSLKGLCTVNKSVMRLFSGYLMLDVDEAETCGIK
jgi:hypothetical protein